VEPGSDVVMKLHKFMSCTWSDGWPVQMQKILREVWWKQTKLVLPKKWNLLTQWTILQYILPYTENCHN